MDSVEERSGYYSELAPDYARYRPSYPNDMFEFFAEVSPSTECVWDCGTGNGQAAVGLVNCFDKVIATDVDPEQISHAFPHERIEYHVMPAENTTFLNGSFDVVTVAQAVHWFNLDLFYKEVQRCVKHEGIVAAWTYKSFSISPEIDELVGFYYNELLGSYWPPQTGHVDSEYKELPFPFEELVSPDFKIISEVSLEQIHGYLSSSSCVQLYREDTGSNPVEKISDKLREAWGGLAKRTMEMPIQMRVGRVRK